MKHAEWHRGSESTPSAIYVGGANRMIPWAVASCEVDYSNRKEQGW